MPIEIQPDQFNTEYLHAWGTQSLDQWFKGHRDDFLTLIYNRVHDRFYNSVLLDHIPEHDLTYCPDTAAEIIERSFAKPRNTRRESILSSVYFATRYGLSCHETLTGETKPTELFGTTAVFVKQMERLPEDVRQDIISALEKGYFQTDSYLYILKQRCYEWSYANGQPVTDLYATCRFVPSLYTAVCEIIREDISPVADRNGFLLAVKANSLCIGIMRLCISCNLAADFFVLQDYSKFAALDGKPLGEQQKLWLSHYLCASPEAKDYALSQIACHMDMDA